eukprot:IDg5044t1
MVSNLDVSSKMQPIEDMFLLRSHAQRRRSGSRYEKMMFTISRFVQVVDEILHRSPVLRSVQLRRCSNFHCVPDGLMTAFVSRRGLHLHYTLCACFCLVSYPHSNSCFQPCMEKTNSLCE